MTQIQAFDLDAPEQAPKAVAIVGAAETVYGNTSSIVLAGRAYTDPWLVRQSYAPSVGVNGAATPQSIPVETLNYTHLHLFDVGGDGAQPSYVGSGTVPGDVKDQFALDEKSGAVRVTTTEQRSGPPRIDGKTNEVSHVFVLQDGGQGLSIVGDAGEIAPGEQLYSTRYVGDKAYVVTWHVTDPLFYGATPDTGPSSTLEVFHVDLESGIQRLGSVDHSSLLATMPDGNYGYCGGYFDGEVRRGVFFENVVYSISYGGILANDVSDLTAMPVASLKLAAPTLPGLSCEAPVGL